MNVVIALTPFSREPAKLRAFSADVNRSSVAVEGVVYIYGGLLVVMRWRRVLRAARTVWPLLALAALTVLSVSWSVDPMVTMRRSVSLLSATIVAVYLGERYSINSFARLLAQTLIVMIILVLVTYVLAPSYVIDYSAYGGAWRGLSAYKNTFGGHMAIAVVLLVLVRFQRLPWTRYVFLPIAAGLLLLSRSANAVACCVVSLAAIPLWRLMRSERRLLAYPLAALIFCLGIYCILAVPEPLFQILGRDPTLTGRTRLWTILLPVIANRPILGYGYAAFWTGLKAEVLSVWIDAERMVPVADNGYIDLCLSLGALGVCAFLVLFSRSFSRAIDYLRSEPGSISLWPITYFCMFAVYNICESTLLTTGTFPFLVFAILATSLAVNHKGEAASARIVNNQPFTGESFLPRSRAGACYLSCQPHL
jgi:O-antigen ligase